MNKNEEKSLVGWKETTEIQHSYSTVYGAHLQYIFQNFCHAMLSLMRNHCINKNMMSSTNKGLSL